MTEINGRAILAGPYALPAARVGDLVRDEMRCRNTCVAAWHETAYGLWPAYGGRKQTRPIVTEELLRGIETEAACVVADLWRVNISTVIRWRARLGLENTRTEIPGTRELLATVSTEAGVLSRPEVMAATAEANRHWTPEEIATAMSGGAVAGRTAKAKTIRLSRAGVLPPRGSHRKAVRPTEINGWAITETEERSAGGDVIYLVKCGQCGETRRVRSCRLGRLKNHHEERS